MLHRTSRLAAILISLLLMSPVACRSAPSAAAAAIPGPDSLPAGSYTLVVNGMSCPKCISNVEMQLVRIEGVAEPTVDMKHGFVHISVGGAGAPRKSAIASAIADSGFTLVEIREVEP